MPEISATYHNLIRPSIVAFVAKYIPVDENNPTPPPFPPILGTGFVIREDGLIATNAHVVRAFGRLFRPPDAPKDEWPVEAPLFRLTEQGMVEVPLKILGVAQISKFDFGKVYYGPKNGPDIALVHVKARGLAPLVIDHETQIKEGMPVCTAGFPMGTDALAAPGWIHQLTPTMQMGNVSAVLPFISKTPHAYSINVMTQGGASGSPVFLPDSGRAIGILYAGLMDIGITLDRKALFKTPTTISYVVPSHYLATLLRAMQDDPNFKAPDDAQTIEDMIAGVTLQNVFEKPREWIVKTVDPEAKLQEHVRFKTKPTDNV